MKTVAIVGAGPAGLSAAHELLKSGEYRVILLEKESAVGGLSRSFEFEGGRVDIGGHRFFSKIADVLDLWHDVLPFGDNAMLVRDRSSHVLWNAKLVSYPLQIDLDTLSSLGATKAMKAIASYLRSQLFARSVDSLEDFYINRFGSELYETFFKGYTRKLWGVPASVLSADWGSQRVRRVSLGMLAKSALCKGGAAGERSLLESYWYPAFGAGQLWEELARRIESLGGEIVLNAQVDQATVVGSRIEKLTYEKEGRHEGLNCDYVISSMPLRDLGKAIDTMPSSVKAVCSGLRYRSMVIVALDFPEDVLGSAFRRLRGDSWIYLQDESVAAGRCQVLNNWSPLATFNAGHVVLELEYYCDEGDALWGASDSDIAALALADLARCGMCKKDSAPSCFFVKRIPDAYPVYMGEYHRLSVIESWVSGIDNLLCIGRNGQHRYNNMDHSVAAGMKAAQILVNGMSEKKQAWDQIADQSYLEECSSA